MLEQLEARRMPIILLLVLTLLVGITPYAATANVGESRVLPDLQRDAAARPDRPFRVIVTRVQRGRGADHQAAALGGRKIKDLKHDAFVAHLPGRAIAALGRHRHVKFIAPDARMLHTDAVDTSRLATLYPASTATIPLWNTWDGAGVGVAVVDTGVQDALPDWNNAAGASRVVAEARFSAGSDNLNDGYGHGTHVAGIIAGNSWWQQDPALQGKYIGVAPGANLIDVKVADDQGVSYISDVVDAIDWVVANRATHNIRVLNLSLVSSVAESYKTSTLSAAVERAWFNGILVVVAAGNAGAGSVGYPPANDPFVLTVGAADPLETAERADDGMAPWSSYGTTQDGVVKPDVVAPGRYMVAPLAGSDAVLARQVPERVVDGRYFRLSGTSMAAPVVAGIAALAFQAHPEWSNDQLKWLLQETALKLGGAAPLAGQGAGEVDAAAVVGYAGLPGLANQGLAINEQLVGPDGQTLYLNPLTSTWSATRWSTSTWSTSTWSTSTWSTSGKWAGVDVE